MFRRFTSSLLLTSLCVCATSSLCATELSVDEAFQLSIKNAPEIQLARLQIEGASAQKDEARSKLLPQASIFGQWSKNDLSYETRLAGFSDNDYYGQRYGVSVRQSLLAVSDGVELGRQNLLVQLSRDEFRLAEAQLLQEVFGAFLEILAADEEVSLLTSELAAVETQLLESKALYAKKLLSVVEVLETEDRRDTLRAELVMAEGQAKVAREALSILTGLRGGEPRDVYENISLLSRYGHPDDAVATAIASDPAVAAAETSVKVAEQAVLREKSRWIPDVSLIYNYQNSDVGFDNLSSPPRDTSTFAIDFRYPLFEGGAKFARVRGASAEYQSALTSLRAQQLDTEVRARTAWLIFDAASDRLVSARRGVKTAEVNVSAVRKSVKAGTARYTDLLLALAQRSRAQRVSVDATFLYAKSWMELELASGALPSLVARSLSSVLHTK
ncbi:MAG: hypothetical protein CL580_04425 [Alteromonadaceae bacterium]|nr:hypothetical protein [Alteromonadaceae bacterium]